MNFEAVSCYLVSGMELSPSELQFPIQKMEIIIPNFHGGHEVQKDYEKY